MQAPEAPSPAGRDAGRAALSRIRHDLLTPLTGVIGYAALVREDAVELGRGDVAAALETLHDDARRLSSGISALELPADSAARFAEELRARFAGPALALHRSAEVLVHGAAPEDAPLLPDLRRVLQSAGEMTRLLERVRRETLPSR
jgi:signal transduction histidine kinase